MLNNISSQDVQDIGIDIIEVEEFHPRLSNKRFMQKVFSESEIEYCNSMAEPSKHLAARWAAKEAVMKATSAVQQLFFDNIIIDRADTGKPIVHLVDTQNIKISALREFDVLISISYTNKQAIAMALVQKGQNGKDKTIPRTNK